MLPKVSIYGLVTATIVDNEILTSSQDALGTIPSHPGSRVTLSAGPNFEVKAQVVGMEWTQY